MRRAGTFASLSAPAVRSTIRSWKEKRYSRRAPRAGLTKPALMRLRVVSGESRRTRSTSRTLYERIPDSVDESRLGVAFTRFTSCLHRRLHALGLLARAEPAHLGARALASLQT